MGERALVIANGNLVRPSAMRERVASWRPDKVIAADGGSQHAASLGLKLDAVVGDLDSLDRKEAHELRRSGVRIERREPSKDETDLELALRFAVDSGADHVVLVGVLGGRLDMTLANVLLLLHAELQSAKIELWHDDQTAWLLRPPGGEIRGESGDTLSLIPLGTAVEGVTTHNLVYPLQDEALTVGPARGVSNVLAGSPARVELSSGHLLAVHTPGRA